MFADHPDFKEAVKLTMKDLVEGKRGLATLTYKFEAGKLNDYSDAVEVLRYIHNQNWLNNFRLGSMNEIIVPARVNPTPNERGTEFLDS